LKKEDSEENHMLRLPVIINDPEFRALCEDYWQTLPGEIEHLGHCLETVIDGQDDGHAYQEAYRLAHQISGSAGSYEMPQTTAEARRLETMLRQMNPAEIDEEGRYLVWDAFNRLKSTTNVLVAA